MSKPLPVTENKPLLRGLYAITDTDLIPAGQLIECVAQVLQGGASMIQYRDKSLHAVRREREVRALLELCRAYQVPLIINDDVALARITGADGVHLGREDQSLADARAQMGPAAIIGISCYASLDLAVQAQAAGADYVAFGSFFPSRTKPQAVLVELDLLAKAKAQLHIPVAVIGGITPARGAGLVSAGADLLAVVQGVFGQPDVRVAARNYAQLFSNKDQQMTRSEELFIEAQQRIPGGVNSPVRAFRGVGGNPLFFKRGEGAYLIDEDDRPYIDYVGSWGPMVLGHAHPAVVNAVREAAGKGLGFGAPTVIETHMAEKICELVPSMEMVRMVSSGTEATMSAIRLARGYTGRDKIVKFEGCYHGHSDSLLIKAGSGALTLGVPSSAGVPAALAAHTITLSYNDLEQTRAAFAGFGAQIACIIVEPVAGNMNCVPPVAGFLEGLRTLCDEYGSVLIFDEVMTGFRVALGGAQQHYGISPDLTTLGKVIGGGLPVAAFGGRTRIMQKIAPLGPVYQAGTLSGNPVAMAAGLATLSLLTQPGFYERLSAATQRLTVGIAAHARTLGVPFACNQVGGMFGLFFTQEENIHNFAQVMQCDVERFKLFFHGMLKEGIYLAPSAFEAGFVSAAHGDAEIDATIAAAERVLATL